MMKKSGKVALGGIIAAFSILILLIAWFPTLTYAAPALAGAILILIVIEVNAKWAFLVYLVVSVLALLICEKEATILFIVFFGYYPIVKAKLERLHNRMFEWVLKLLLFNVAVILAYLVIINVFLIPLDIGFLNKYGVPVLLGLGNVVFLLYDIGLTRVISFYLASWHKKINKLTRG